MAIDLIQIKPALEKLAEEYGLSLVLLFGSQATGKTHLRSDIDIAYFAREPLSLAEESRLIIELMGIFRTEAVDLVSLQNAPPQLRYQIARFGKTIYERKPGLFSPFYINALRQYEEAKPLFQLRSDYLAKRFSKINV
mgnify:CR=1 FL=1